MPTRRSSRRRPSRRVTKNNQRYTFRNVNNISGALTTAAAGTASRLTNLTDRIETAISAPDIELGRALLVSVAGQGCARPTTVGTAFVYSYGLYIGPDTLDIADIDPNIEGVEGKPYWAHRNVNICPNTHLRSVTATTFENETEALSFRISTRGSRRLKAFGESLWFAESVELAGLTDCIWTFRIGVEYN